MNHRGYRRRRHHGKFYRRVIRSMIPVAPAVVSRGWRRVLDVAVWCLLLPTIPAFAWSGTTRHRRRHHGKPYRRVIRSMIPEVPAVVSRGWRWAIGLVEHYLHLSAKAAFAWASTIHRRCRHQVTRCRRLIRSMTPEVPAVVRRG